MTFSDMCGNTAACETSTEQRVLTIGHALERCLMRAVAAQRVTVGIQECAKLLGCAPERVMLCVIPDMAGSSDVGMHIQHTLVRSFCWENDIRLLTVKNCKKFQNIIDCAWARCQGPGVNDSSSDATETLPSSSITTPSCVLVEGPAKEDLSADEDFVCDYHDTVMYSSIFPKPIIQLPV